MPVAERFRPYPRSHLAPSVLDPAEVEALRLIDVEKLSFEEAGKRMNISRNTVWRLVEAAREKIAKAIVQGQEIQVQKER